MNNILDETLSKQTTEIEDYKFIGKLAVTSWKYDGTVNYLKKLRQIIIVMGLAILYPVLANYLFLDHFSLSIFIERVFLSCILFLCAGLYKKIRLISIIVALVPIGLLLYLYITNLDYFSVKRFGFNGAVFLIVLAGIYFDYREKKLKTKLQEAMENGHPDVILRKK